MEDNSGPYSNQEQQFKKEEYKISFKDDDDDDDEWALEIEQDLVLEKKRAEYEYDFPKEVLMIIMTYVRVGMVCKSWTEAINTLARRKFKSVLYRILDSNTIHVHDIANNIEEELFIVCKRRITRIYHRKARQLVFNIKDVRNHSLRSRLLTGELSPSTLVRMDSNSMANPQLVRQREQWLKKRKQEVIRDIREVAGFTETSLFTCPQCGSTRTRYREWRRKAVVDRTRIRCICIMCPYQWEV